MQTISPINQLNDVLFCMGNWVCKKTENSQKEIKKAPRFQSETLLMLAYVSKLFK